MRMKKRKRMMAMNFFELESDHRGLKVFIRSGGKGAELARVDWSGIKSGVRQAKPYLGPSRGLVL